MSPLNRTPAGDAQVHEDRVRAGLGAALLLGVEPTDRALTGWGVDRNALDRSLADRDTPREVAARELINGIMARHYAADPPQQVAA